MVADTGARLPATTIEAEPLQAIVVYGWILAGFIASRPRLTVAVVAVVVLLGVGMGEQVDVDKRKPFVVERDTDIEAVPPGTTVIIVREGHRDRPTLTPDGIPVIYPYNDQHDQSGPLRRR